MRVDLGTAGYQEGTDGCANVLDQSQKSWESPRGPVETTDGDAEYFYVAPSLTDKALGAGGGAAGDRLAELLCIVATAATCQVSIKDGTIGLDGNVSPDVATVLLPASVGAGVGTYRIRCGWDSKNGAWKVTTGAGVTVIARGDFT